MCSLDEHIYFQRCRQNNRLEDVSWRATAINPLSNSAYFVPPRDGIYADAPSESLPNPVISFEFFCKYDLCILVHAYSLYDTGAAVRVAEDTVRLPSFLVVKDENGSNRRLYRLHTLSTNRLFAIAASPRVVSTYRQIATDAISIRQTLKSVELGLPMSDGQRIKYRIQGRVISKLEFEKAQTDAHAQNRKRRWKLFRNLALQIELCAYLWKKSVESGCGPGGRLREEDANAFASDFNPPSPQ